MGPAILVTIGVLFLVGTITDGRFDFGRTWPVLLIVIGALKLAQRSASTAGHIEPTLPGYVPVQAVQPFPVQAIQPVQPPTAPYEPPPQSGSQPPSSEVNNG